MYVTSKDTELVRGTKIVFPEEDIKVCTKIQQANIIEWGGGGIPRTALYLHCLA
jgi:hypothetical protein